MTERIKWFLLIIALELVSIFADYLIKRASLQAGWVGWKPLLIGGFIYGATAIGWFYAMRVYKLFTINMFHSFFVIAVSILMSQFIFGEKLTMRELVGIALGIASIVLLIRFKE